jgi:hypothetical protein
MSDINNEIDQVAEQMEKSHKTPKEALFDTIRELGPEGIRAKLPTLEKSEQILLLGALEEMAKGGPGSGQKGHTTAERQVARAKALTQSNLEHVAHQKKLQAKKDQEQRAKANAFQSDTAERLSAARKKERMGKADDLVLDPNANVAKAVEMDKDYAAKYVQGKIEDTKIQEDKADDDQDEKLVKPEAAKMNHQGTPTDGWEGQVIKGKEMSKEKAKEKLMDMEEKEHGTKDPKKLVEAEKKEHAKKDMEKAHVGFKAVEEKAREEGAEDPKAVAAAVGIKKYGKEGMEAKARAGKMKKGEEMDEKMKDAKKKAKSGDKEKMMEGLKEMKKALELSMPEASAELIKGEMKRLLKEEDQDGDAPEMKEAIRAKKESVPALELAKDSKEAQKKVDDEKQGMKKSTAWSEENALLKAMTGGRNHHFSMEEYINEVLNAKPEAEEIQKSEKKEDLNDIIAKGGDASWDQINCDRRVKENVAKQRGTLVKSFETNEIAEALGLSPEEAKKILGE